MLAIMRTLTSASNDSSLSVNFKASSQINKTEANSSKTYPGPICALGQLVSTGQV